MKIEKFRILWWCVLIYLLYNIWPETGYYTFGLLTALVVFMEGQNLVTREMSRLNSLQSSNLMLITDLITGRGKGETKKRTENET